MRSIISASLLALGLSGTMATAQSTTMCGLTAEEFASQVAPKLDGYWAGLSRGGYLNMQGRSMALPAGQTWTATIAYENGKLMASDSEIPGNFELKYVSGQNWDIDPTSDNPVNSQDIMSSEEVSILAGCGPNELPRLHASGQFKDPESGMMVDFDTYLLVISDGILYGTTMGRTPMGIAARAITLSK